MNIGLALVALAVAAVLLAVWHIYKKEPPTPLPSPDAELERVERQLRALEVAYPRGVQWSKADTEEYAELIAYRNRLKHRLGKPVAQLA